MKEETIFVGTGWANQEGWAINISVCLSDIPKEYITEYKGKKYIKLGVIKRKSEGDKGQTHFVKVDTYKKEKEQEEDTISPDDLDNLPF